MIRRVQASGKLPLGNAWFAPRQNPQPVIVPLIERVPAKCHLRGHHQRYKNIRGFPHLRARKPLTRDAHNGHLNVVDKQTLVEDAPIATKMPCPICMAQHNDGMPSGYPFIIEVEYTADGRWNAKHFKIVPGNKLARPTLRLPTAGNTRRKAVLA